MTPFCTPSTLADRMMEWRREGSWCCLPCAGCWRGVHWTSEGQRDANSLKTKTEWGGGACLTGSGGGKASLWGKGPVRKRSMKAKRMEWGGGGSWRGEGGFINERSKAGRRQRRLCQHKSVLGRVFYWWRHLVQLLTQQTSLCIYMYICRDIITGVSWRLTWGSFACAVDLPLYQLLLCLHVCRDLQRLHDLFHTLVFHLGFVYLVTWHLSAPQFWGKIVQKIWRRLW